MLHKLVKLFEKLLENPGLYEGRSGQQSPRFLKNKREYVFNIQKEKIHPDDGECNVFKIMVYKHEYDPKYHSITFYIQRNGVSYISHLNDEVREKERFPQLYYVDILLEYFDVDTNPGATAMELSSIPVNSSPYVHDRERSGTHLWGGWEAMWKSEKAYGKDGTPYDEMDELILVDTKTGRRFSVDLTEITKEKK